MLFPPIVLNSFENQAKKQRKENIKHRERSIFF